ncbi:MAG: FGGY-family carbohydrate kinase, partial [Bacteroidaceae bacterium]
ASTSQLLNPHTKQFDEELLKELGLTADKFGKMVLPGTKIGSLSEEVKKLTGLGDIPVIAVAGHDTASAVAAVPSGSNRFAYLSSGTWSLMGVEVPQPIISEKSYRLNFTNEGGADGSIRFLKNICGMWLLEQCRKEWAREQNYSYEELIEAALNAPAFQSFINPDAPCFANPDSMIGAIKNYCKETGQVVPATFGEITRCIFESLALRYKQVLEYLQELAPSTMERLHVIGGGSKNDLLNAFTANALGLPVVAGPSEATAIGNIMLQAKASGDVADLRKMREVIRNSMTTLTFLPDKHDGWDEAYSLYLKNFRENI